MVPYYLSVSFYLNVCISIDFAAVCCFLSKLGPFVAPWTVAL